MSKETSEAGSAVLFWGGLGLVLTGVMGWLLGAIAERALPGLLILVLEPLIWVGVGILAARLLLHRRWRAAGFLLVGLGLLTLNLRGAPLTREPSAELTVPGPTLRYCASKVEAPQGTLRLVTWRGEEMDAQALSGLRQLDADLLMIDGLDEPALVGLAAELAVEPSGRMRAGDWTLLVPGGFFGVCGEQQQERWELNLPAAPERATAASLVFASVPEVGLVPLLAFSLDRPAGVGELGDWSGRVQGSGQSMARYSQALGSGALLVAGDTGLTGPLRDLTGSMQGAGLRSAPTRTTWPASLFSLPLPALYQPQRVFHGPDWQVHQVSTVRLTGPHLALVTELRPS